MSYIFCLSCSWPLLHISIIGALLMRAKDFPTPEDFEAWLAMTEPDSMVSPGGKVHLVFGRETEHPTTLCGRSAGGYRMRFLEMDKFRKSWMGCANCQKFMNRALKNKVQPVTYVEELSQSMQDFNESVKKMGNQLAQNSQALNDLIERTHK